MNKKAKLLLTILPVIAFFISLNLGQYHISPADIFRILLQNIISPGPGISITAKNVIWDERLPRVVLAMLVGASLSISGSTFQGLFRNPLVSPDILGVAGGASFGAAIGILYFNTILAIQLWSFAFGLIAVYAAYAIGRVRGQADILTLVLAGIIVGSVFSALVASMKYVADPYSKLPTLVFFLLGSFSSTTVGTVEFAAPGIIIGLVILLVLRWRINLLSLGDSEARLLGVNTERLKFVVITASTLLVAIAVSVAGVIGWVGLIIPHIARMIVGPDHKDLLPASVAIGATFLLVVDDIARTATTGDLPIGMLTAFVGAPIFAILLRRSKKAGWA